MKAYKKRAKQSWNAGKRGKENSDPAERQFVKREILQAISEMDADYLHRHKGKRKRNDIARLQHRIKWYEERIEHHARTHSDWFWSWARDSIARDRKKLKELLDKEAAKA